VLVYVQVDILHKMIQLEDAFPNVNLEHMDKIDGVILILSTVLLTPLLMMPTIYVMLAVLFSQLGEISQPKDVLPNVH
jgi:hypothetical protein